MDFELKQQEVKFRKHLPSYSQSDKIHEHIKEWNTIPHIYRLKTLYLLYNRLFLLTYENKLECLNYYIDMEKESDTGKEYTVMYAEIKDTWNLPIKERFKKHADLLKRVVSNDTTLIYSENSETQTEEEGQLSLFG